MSRLNTLSSRAIASMFSVESKDGIAMLLTLTGGGLAEPLYVTTASEERVSEDAQNVGYGLTSNGIEYTFVDMQVAVPDDMDESPASCQIVVNDVTRQIKPLLRQATGRISVDIAVVLIQTPDVIEASWPGLAFSNFSYQADQITCQLTYPGDQAEPIPCDIINPAEWPGAF